jgi:hypothetical protein
MSTSGNPFITEDVFKISDEQSLRDGLLFNELVAGINDMINTNFERLISLLYRIDVNEEKLKSLLRQNESEDAGRIIATLIINRQLDKIRSRKENKTAPDDIPEDEKW